MSVATGVSLGLRGLPDGLPRLTPVDRRFFADGLRTSGQHPPIESQLRSFDQFPKRITGPTVWTPEEMADNPDKWIHKWTSSELAELERAVDAFTSSGIPLVNISKVSLVYPCPSESRLTHEKDKFSSTGTYSDARYSTGRHPERSWLYLISWFADRHVGQVQSCSRDHGHFGPLWLPTISEQVGVDPGSRNQPGC